MTETIVCACCHKSFDRIVIEETVPSEPTHLTFAMTEAPEPVCEDCEHEYLSWAGCPPLC